MGTQPTRLIHPMFLIHCRFSWIMVCLVLEKHTIMTTSHLLVLRPMIQLRLLLQVLGAALVVRQRITTHRLIVLQRAQKDGLDLRMKMHLYIHLASPMAVPLHLQVPSPVVVMSMLTSASSDFRTQMSTHRSTLMQWSLVARQRLLILWQLRHRTRPIPLAHSWCI